MPAPESMPGRLLRFLALRPGYPWKKALLILAPLLLLMLTAGLALSFWGDTVRLWHENIRQSYPKLTAVLQFCSDVLPSTVFALYIPLLLRAMAKHKTEEKHFVLRFTLGALFFAMLLNQGLKALFGMPRPGFPMPPQPFLFEHSYTSFPSGHTISIVTSTLPIALWTRFRQSPALAALLIALVGYSRIWLGRHHPVDVLAGMLVGLAASRWIFTPRNE
ncbi:phosphatase PAP2 family protein [Desulfovibrio sp. OttesenSCG-928-A18]|nr:phosphatase PAP2 family protein [Desulfovibrio sp. OttesenSCG-928-A18]